ncbi:hypothetical protein IU485_04650 [Nocardia cyriacigeorgica]|uniref:hypothetical protein n=1 Tax=Nocardia cyriacigeorgica TaxID=135487 RepID=UPI0018934CC5|nr:hypothetical protein [Nocardia cyriacigeorgica]MBF6080644.1 hypothetical protein [Nocardia cyriacigeorgica]
MIPSHFENSILHTHPNPPSAARLPRRPHAIGYLRADRTTNPGFTHARLRLLAIAHGYHLTHILTVPGQDPTTDLLRLLRTLTPDTEAVLTPDPTHLTDRQTHVLRTFCALHTGDDLHPRVHIDR